MSKEISSRQWLISEESRHTSYVSIKRLLRLWPPGVAKVCMFQSVLCEVIHEKISKNTCILATASGFWNLKRRKIEQPTKNCLKKFKKHEQNCLKETVSRDSTMQNLKIIFLLLPKVIVPCFFLFCHWNGQFFKLRFKNRIRQKI